MTVRTAAASHTRTRTRTAHCPTCVDGFDRLVGDVHTPYRSVCIDLPNPLAEAQR
ncbi:hypothetical protein CU044_6102 [Streptomyces sp. L-9-10]|nr:hypothetical protein CU044_6102 [Streptomyces sp. L-9-10]